MKTVKEYLIEKNLVVWKGGNPKTGIPNKLKGKRFREAFDREFGLKPL